MSSPYIGELRVFSFQFPPRTWALCNGQTLSITQNQALFAVIGTIYGGNGVTTFQLPNLQGRVAVDQGDGSVIGQAAGETNHTLSQSEIPLHNHLLKISSAASTLPTAANSTPAAAASTIGSVYLVQRGATMMAPQAIALGGQSQPHSNVQPYLVLSVCICLSGIFPSRT